jgi:hypothetical protein
MTVRGARRAADTGATAPRYQDRRGRPPFYFARNDTKPPKGETMSRIEETIDVELDAPAPQFANPCLEHFINLLLRGRHSGASGGERRAYKIAKALLEHAPGLDAKALAGISPFAEMVSRNPQEIGDLLR